jgi:neutral ceramidase
MLGYASLDQSANGIHQRLKARAFVFASSVDPSQRVVYVSLETGECVKKCVCVCVRD